MATKYVKLFENWLNEDENKQNEQKPFNPDKPSLTNVLLIKTEDIEKNPQKDGEIIESIVDRIASKMGEKNTTVNVFKYYMGEPDYKNGLFPLFKNAEDTNKQVIWKPFSEGGETKGLLPFASGKGPQEPKGNFYLETYVIPMAEDWKMQGDILNNDKVLIIAKSDKKSKMALNSKWWLWNHKKRVWELVSLGQIAMFGSSDFKDQSYLTDATKSTPSLISGYLDMKDFYEEPES
jgi:hypothetical protein